MSLTHKNTHKEQYKIIFLRSRSTLLHKFTNLCTCMHAAYGKSKALERSKKVPLHIARHGLMESGIHCAVSPPSRQQQASKSPASSAGAMYAMSTFHDLVQQSYLIVQRFIIIIAHVTSPAPPPPCEYIS